MTVLSFPPNGPHPLGWVKTKLKANDELGSFGSHIVADNSSLSKLYGLTAKDIVENNGIRFDTAPINQWVLDTGGIRLGSQPVFGPNSVIFLPAGGPRVPAGSGGVITRPGAGAAKGSIPSWIWIVSGVALLGGVAYYASRQPEKKRSVSTPV